MNKIYTLAVVLIINFVYSACAEEIPVYTQKLNQLQKLAQDTIIQAVTNYYNAHEPSSEIQALASQAIQTLGITQEIIVLESDTLNSEARAVRIFFPFLLVSSFKIQESSNIKEYAIYRALADIYYDHGGVNRAKVLVFPLGLAVLNYMLGKHIDTYGSTAATSCNMGVLSALVLAVLTAIGDCVESNQESIELACNQLIKQDKIAVIEQELLTKRPAGRFEASSQTRRYILAKCLQDNQQMDSLRRVLAEAKAVYDVELVSILMKKLGIRSSRALQMLAKGRAPMPSRI